MSRLLSLIVFFPVLGSFFILLNPSKGDSNQSNRWIASSAALITFIMSCILIASFHGGTSELQFVEKAKWIESLNINYFLGVDGINALLIPVTTFIFLLALLASKDFSTLQKGSKGFYILFLLFETTILGTFASFDLFQIFVFWTASILPCYFMIGVWGNKQKEQAANNFFIYQLLGAGLILLAMLALYYVATPHQFDLLQLGKSNFANLQFSFQDRELRFDKLILIFFLVGFALRMAVVPFHGWLGSVLVEAPSVLSVAVVAIFIKTGCYAFLRIGYGLFPEAMRIFSSGLSVIGVVSLIYGGLCAAFQNDLRKIMAYCTVSHMGLVLLGIGVMSEVSVSGSLLHSVSHALFISLALFLIGILGNRSKEFEIRNEKNESLISGLVLKAPIMTGFFTVAVFSVLGLPGMGGFISQILILMGAYPYSILITGLCLVGIAITVGYVVSIFKRVFWGSVSESVKTISDIQLRDQLYLLPLILICIFTGSYPTPILHKAESTIRTILEPQIGTNQNKVESETDQSHVE